MLQVDGSEEIHTTEKLVGVTSVMARLDTRGSLAIAEGSIPIVIKSKIIEKTKVLITGSLWWVPSIERK
jgi:hypothetical protein